MDATAACGCIVESAPKLTRLKSVWRRSLPKKRTVYSVSHSGTRGTYQGTVPAGLPNVSPSLGLGLAPIE